MKKKLLLAVPIAAVLLAVLIGGIYSANASDADFSQSGDTLIAYLGSAEEVTIPSSVRRIGSEAFAGNTVLQRVTIPESVTEIQYAAFAGCSALKSVSIPDSVTQIEDSAFNGCSALSDVYLGSSVYTMGSGVFADCDSLSEIRIAPENPSLLYERGALYNSNKTILYQYFAGYPAHTYTLPGTVTEVRRYSFWGCDELQQITLTGMSRLSDYAVANASGLVNVVLTAPINEIGIGAFSGDSKLQQIVLPLSIRTIHETAFEGCPESMIVVADPSSAAWRYAEEHEMATSASPVIVIEVVEEEALTAQSGTAAEPAASTAEPAAQTPEAGGNTETAAPAEETAESGGRAAGNILLGGTQVVSDRAYVAVDRLTVSGGNESGATTPVDTGEAASQEQSGGAAIAEIVDYAHYLDQLLDRYDFAAEAGLERIGRFAFARTNLTQAVIPEGVTEIGEGAFYHCDRLSEVTIPASVTSVGRSAFLYTPWYQAWWDDADAEDFLIVGDGVLIGYKGKEAEVTLPDTVKVVAEGVFGE